MKKHLLFLLLFAFVAFKCGKNEPVRVQGNPHAAQIPLPPANLKNDAILYWNEFLISAIRVDKTSPPVASRAMAILNLSMYDAINSTKPRFAPYRPSVRPNPNANSIAALHSAAHRALVYLYPVYQATFDHQYGELLKTIPDNRSRADGIFQGQIAADATIEPRRNDLNAKPYLPVPPTGPGVWRPTLPKHATFLLPGWGGLAPFGLQSGSQFRSLFRAPRITETTYQEALNDVRKYDGRTMKARYPEESIIANFWEDKAGTMTPPGHWLSITRITSERITDPLLKARLFALVSMSLADAAIVCWDMKAFSYNWRPITAIRESSDPNWSPLLDTPPFPDYVSGHSTFSGAAAHMLAKVYGTDQVAFSVGTDEIPNLLRRFAKLSDAAKEAGRSRIFGGIHFEFANRDGLQLGSQVAEYNFRTYFRPVR